MTNEQALLKARIQSLIYNEKNISDEEVCEVLSYLLNHHSPEKVKAK